MITRDWMNCVGKYRNSRTTSTRDYWRSMSDCETPRPCSRRVRGHARPAPGSPAGGRRPVPALALSEARHVVAGAPLFVVGAAHGQPAAHHGEAARRPQRVAQAAHAGHARGHRRPVRDLHPPRTLRMWMVVFITAARSNACAAGRRRQFSAFPAANGSTHEGVRARVAQPLQRRLQAPTAQKPS